MALKTLVKVGSITNLSDARYCAGMGVDFLGFRVIEGQPGMIPARTFQEIRGWITGPQIVAEIYGLKSPEQLNSILEEIHPDYLELSMEEFGKVGSIISLPYILKISPTEEIPIEVAEKPAYLLIEGAIDSSTSRFIPDYELLVRAGTKEDVEAAISHTGVSGIALDGGSEIRPGLKDYDGLSMILEALEED